MTREEARRLLGVSPGFSEADLKTAWKKAAMEHHPDRGGDEEMFKKISQAHDLLQRSVNPASGARYNAHSNGGTSWRGGTSADEDYSYEDFNPQWGSGMSEEQASELMRKMREQFEEQIRQAHVNRKYYHEIFFDVSIEEAFKGCKHSINITTRAGNIVKEIDVRAGVMENELITIVEDGNIVYRVFVKIRSEYMIDWGQMGNPFDRGNITKMLQVSPFKMITGGWEVVKMIDGGSVKVYIPAGSPVNTLLKVGEKGYWRGDKLEHRGHCFLRLIPKIQKLGDMPKEDVIEFQKILREHTEAVEKKSGPTIEVKI